jgi:hypothetical protein
MSDVVSWRIAVVESRPICLLVRLLMIDNAGPHALCRRGAPPLLRTFELQLAQAAGRSRHASITPAIPASPPAGRTPAPWNATSTGAASLLDRPDSEIKTLAINAANLAQGFSVRALAIFFVERGPKQGITLRAHHREDASRYENRRGDRFRTVACADCSVLGKQKASDPIR